MRPIIREGDPAVWGTTSLASARGVKAIQPLDGGKRIIAIENYGDIAPGLAIYDSETLKRERVWVLPESDEIPNALAVVSDPERVIINFYDHLCGIDLVSQKVFGDPIKLKYHRLAPKWWQAAFEEKESFEIGQINVFDSGKLLIAHCGPWAPDLPSNLICWHLPSLEQISGPIYTLDPALHYNTFYRGKTGVPDYKRRQFISTGSSGRINCWNIDDLSLDRTWQLEVNSASDRTWYTDNYNRMHAAAVCQERDLLAIGTYHGSVYIQDLETGEPVFAPLIPEDRDFSDNNRTYDRKMKNEITGIGFFADGRRLLVGYEDGSLNVWDTVSHQQMISPVNPTEFKLRQICTHQCWKKVLIVVDDKYGKQSQVLILDTSHYI